MQFKVASEQYQLLNVNNKHETCLKIEIETGYRSENSLKKMEI